MPACWHPAVNMAEHALESSESQEVKHATAQHSKYVLSSEDVAKAQQELQQQLQQLGIAVPGEVTIQRFYRATAGNYKLTVKRLVSTAKWRHQKQAQHMSCSTCARNKHAHFMHPVGFDKLGRPVLFTSYVMVQEAALNGNIEHMISEFERAVRIMDSKHQGAESWHWIMDFRGFGRRLNDLNPALPLAFLDVSANHYPERLGELLIIDAPSILTPLWNMLRPLMDPVTHDKIKFLPYDVPTDLQLSSSTPQAGVPAAVDAVVTAVNTNTALKADGSGPAASDTSHQHAIQPPSQAALNTRQVPKLNAAEATPQPEGQPPVQPDVLSQSQPVHQSSEQGAGKGVSAEQQHKQQPAKQSKLLHELQRMADDEMVNWVVQELRVLRAWDAQPHGRWGRSSKQELQVERPCWDVDLLHKAVTSGQLELLPRDKATGHCHYGTASFLSHMLTCPGVLLPPAAADSTS